MKKLLITCLIILVGSFQFAMAQQQSVSIGTSNIDTDAVLMLVGNGNQGLIIPVTGNIGSVPPKAGMVVYNTVDKKIYYSDGDTWASLGGATAGATPTLAIEGNNISIFPNASVKLAGTAPTQPGQLFMWDGQKWTSTSGSSPQLDQFLKWNGTSWVPATLPGAASGTVTEVTGTAPITIATGTTTPAISIAAGGITNSLLAANSVTSSNITNASINASHLSSLGATNSGQVLQWNGSAWAPASLPSTTTGNFSTPNTAIQITGGGNAVIGAGTTINIPNATATQTGLLSATDFDTFSKKGDMLKSVYDTDNDGVADAAATVNYTSQAVNTVLAAPSANAGTPSFRLLTATDIPALDAAKITTGTLPVVRGGTGVTTAPTNGQLLIGGTNGFSLGTLTAGTGVTVTNASGTITIASTGMTSPMTSAGDIIFGSGANATPTRLATGTGFLKGGTTPSYSKVDISSSNDITGTLPIASGGTGATTATAALTALGGMSNPMTAQGDIIYGGASGAPTKLATGPGFLKGGATPSYSAVNLASTDVTGTLPINRGGTNSTATPTDGGIAYGDGTAIAYTTAGTTGQVLQSNGANPPTWGPAGLSSTLTSANIFVGNGSNVATGAAMSGDATITNAGNLQLTAGTIVDADVNASAAIAGTKVAPNFGAQNIVTTGTLTTGTAARFVVDANGNITKINNITTSFPAAQGAAGTVLTNNGSGTLTWGPAGLSSTLNSAQIFVGNGSNVATGVAMSGDATITNAGALSIANTATAGTNIVTAINNAGATGTIPTTRLPTAVVLDTEVPNAAGDISGDFSTGLQIKAGGVNLASTDVTGTLPIVNGGTNRTTAGTAGTILYSDGTNLVNTAAGTAGQVLTSNGAGTPTWGAAGLSSTLTSANIFVGSGTNVATGVAMSGDATISNTGALNIQPDVITNVEILDASITGADVALATLDNTHISATAAIAVSKLAAGTNGQVLTTVAGAPAWAAGGWALGGNTITNPLTEYIGTTSNHDLAFRANGSEAMRIAANGNVGIGTTTPATRFEVVGASNGDGLTVSGSSDNTMSYLVNTAAGGNTWALSSTGGASGNGQGSFAITEGPSFGTTRMLIKPGGAVSQVGLVVGTSFGYFYTGTPPAAGAIIEGNVGIGTTTPAAKLDVIGALKITDGSEGLGKVLTSDANGLASWQTVAGTGDMTKAAYDADDSGEIDLTALPPEALLNSSIPNSSGDISGDYSSGLYIQNNATAGSNIVTAINTSSGSINGARVNPSFGAQNISTTGTVTAGTTGQFTVDANGNITKINNITTSFPASQGAAGTVLTNDGAGNLTWGSGSGWSLGGNTGTNPANDFIGTTDAQPLVFGTDTGGAGGERMRITETGNVGIGTATPQAGSLLHLEGGKLLVNNSLVGLDHSEAGIIVQSQIDGTAGSIGTYTNHPFYLTTNGSPGFALDATGKVGIGTTTPTVLLDVRGVDNSNIDFTGTSGVKLRSTVSTSFSEFGNVTNHDLHLLTNNNVRMGITAAGDVGIGTTIPIADFVVSREASRTDAAVFSHSSTPTHAPNFYLIRRRGTESTPTAVQSGDNMGTIGFIGDAGGAISEPSASIDATALENFTGSAQGTEMALSTIGIGEATPSKRLVIDGTGAITIPDLATGGVSEMVVADATGVLSTQAIPSGGFNTANAIPVGDGSTLIASSLTDDGTLVTVGGNLDVTDRLVVDQTDANTGTLASNSLTFGNASGEGIASTRSTGSNQNGLDFYTASAPRLSITNGGNVGIGTPSPSQPLTVQGSIIVDNGSLYNQTFNNTLRFGPGTDAIIGGGDFNGGQLDFYTVGSPRMTVNSTGNVGIGTTSPQDLLHVNGATVGQIRITNNSIGTSNTDGLTLRIDNAGEANINTAENQMLILGANGNNVVHLTPGGFMGLNNNNPAATLDVSGTFKFVDGNQANNRVLTSDANGNASWQNSPAGFANPMTTDGDMIYQSSGNAVALAGGTPGILKTDGTTPSWGAVDLSGTDVSNVLPISSGGTGAMSAAGAITNLGLGPFATAATISPSDLSNGGASSGDVLVFNGVNWAPASNSGGWSVGGNNITDPSTEYIGTNSINDLAFRANGNEGIRLTAAGNVGIGTTTPTQNLTVQGGLNIDGADANDGTSANNTLHFGGTSGETIGSRRTAGVNQFGLDFYTNDIARMSITQAGNVGIGGTNPGTKLHVFGNAGMFRLEGTDHGYMEFNVGSTRQGWLGYGFGGSTNLTLASDVSGGNIIFETNAGNVGVGTTTPTAKVSVSSFGETDGVNNTAVYANSTASPTAENVYGLYANANGNGEGGNFAIGLYATAAGAINNYAAIFQNGKVQINEGIEVPGDGFGTAGQVLTSSGGGAMTWENPASGFSTANFIPKGDGSSLVASNISDDGSTVLINSPLTINSGGNNAAFAADGSLTFSGTARMLIGAGVNAFEYSGNSGINLKLNNPKFEFSGLDGGNSPYVPFSIDWTTGETLVNSAFGTGTMRITNTTMGTAATDGLEIDLDNTGAAHILNNESGNLVLGTGGTSVVNILSSGKVGFNATPGAAEAFIVGSTATNGNGASLTIGGVWTNASDSTKKTNIKPIPYGLSEVMKLRPVSYQLKGTSKQDFGFLAQEVKQVLPEIVYGEEGKMSISYGQITSVLTAGMQELVKQNEEQAKAIKELKDLLAAKDKQMATLEASLKQNQNLSKEFETLKADLEKIKQLLGAEAKKD